MLPYVANIFCFNTILWGYLFCFMSYTNICKINLGYHVLEIKIKKEKSYKKKNINNLDLCIFCDFFFVLLFV